MEQVLDLARPIARKLAILGFSDDYLLLALVKLELADKYLQPKENRSQVREVILRELATVHQPVVKEKKSYADYLKGDHWQSVRQWALEKAEWRCQLCNKDEDLQVHHRTYARVGKELPADLTVLCGDCHARFHHKIGADA